MKNIKIEYFAILREHAGTDAEELATEAATVAQLYAELESRYGFPELSSIKAAVNDEFSDWQAAASVLPEIPAPGDRMELRASVYISPGQAYTLGEVIGGARWPRRALHHQQADPPGRRLDAERGPVRAA